MHSNRKMFLIISQIIFFLRRYCTLLIFCMAYLTWIITLELQGREVYKSFIIFIGMKYHFLLLNFHNSSGFHVSFSSAPTLIFKQKFLVDQSFSTVTPTSTRLSSGIWDMVLCLCWKISSLHKSGLKWSFSNCKYLPILTNFF